MSYLRPVFALAAASLVSLSPCFARAQAAAPAPAPATSGQLTVLVHSDVSKDATENAQLRAAAYEAAAQRGFVARRDAPEPKPADLDTTRITNEADALQLIRRGFGVDLFVRITRRNASTLEVTVASVGHVEVRSVDVGTDARAAVAAAAGELIDGVVGAIPPGTAAATPGATGTAPAPAGQLPAEGEAPDDPKAIRAAWARRGGTFASYEVRALATRVQFPDSQFTSTNPQGRPERGGDPVVGWGGGLGIGIAMQVLPLPDPAEGVGSFIGFRLAGGADLALVSLHRSIGFVYDQDAAGVSSRNTESESYTLLDLNFPVRAGVQAAFGSYRTPRTWRGMVLGLAWAPTLEHDIEVGRDRSATRFNYAGLELTLDLARLELGEDLTKRHRDASLRVAVMLLPRVASGDPWQTTLAIGAVWY